MDVSRYKFADWASLLPKRQTQEIETAHEENVFESCQTALSKVQGKSDRESKRLAVSIEGVVQEEKHAKDKEAVEKDANKRQQR